MLSGVVLKTQSDARLADLAANGSDAAFEALVHRYRRALLCYCRRLLLSDSRCEDVVQQAFINAWSALRGGAEIREVRAWLYRITHNQAVSALRRPDHEFAELSESLGGLDAPDVAVDRRITMRDTLAAVAALPELQREAILRTAIDGCSYEEVADALGVTDHAVRGLVYRARTSLRAALAAVAPAPIVVWATGHARRSGGASQWVGELIAGSGTAGGSAAVLKGTAVLCCTAAVVGGTVTATLAPQHTPPPASHHRVTKPAAADSVRAVRTTRTAPVTIAAAVPVARRTAAFHTAPASRSGATLVMASFRTATTAKWTTTSPSHDGYPAPRRADSVRPATAGPQPPRQPRELSPPTQLQPSTLRQQPQQPQPTQPSPQPQQPLRLQSQQPPPSQQTMQPAARSDRSLP